jgi:hypothetical protein
MKQAIIKQIEQLSTEAALLSQARDQHHQAIQNIEIRMHQIAGAITAMDTLLKGEYGDEVRTSDKQEIQGRSGETSSGGPTP